MVSVQGLIQEFEMGRGGGGGGGATLQVKRGVQGVFI